MAVGLPGVQSLTCNTILPYTELGLHGGEADCRAGAGKVRDEPVVPESKEWSGLVTRLQKPA